MGLLWDNRIEIGQTGRNSSKGACTTTPLRINSLQYRTGSRVTSVAFGEGTLEESFPSECRTSEETDKGDNQARFR